MKVSVNQDSCIGCGACAAICDAIFEINDDGLSEVKNDNVSADLQDDVRDAADSCPTGAIEVEE